jgi:hypothetical protein
MLALLVCDETELPSSNNPKADLRVSDKKEAHSAWFDGLVEVVADDSGDTHIL